MLGRFDGAGCSLYPLKYDVSRNLFRPARSRKYTNLCFPFLDSGLAICAPARRISRKSMPRHYVCTHPKMKVKIAKHEANLRRRARKHEEARTNKSRRGRECALRPSRVFKLRRFARCREQVRLRDRILFKRHVALRSHLYRSRSPRGDHSRRELSANHDLARQRINKEHAVLSTDAAAERFQRHRQRLWL